MTTTTESEISGWLHLMPQLPVTDIERSIAYYEEALGFRLAWRHSNGDLAALANGEIETLLLVRWAEDGPPPQQSAYVYVEDPDAVFAEYAQAGADILDPVTSRPSGMRDFVVRDPDGHRFTLGRGEERLRTMTDQYLIEPPGEITVNPRPRR